MQGGWSRAPGGLFWKVFAACWFTSLLTGVGINLAARAFPGLIELPPHPPRLEQSVGMPVLVGALIALGLSGLLAWSLSRPIRLLRQAFSDAAAGQLTHRVGPQLGRQRDEFAELGHDYDRMAQQLQALLGAQRRLLHDVSHELRSPLARLQMATGLLRHNPQGLPQALARIDHEVERLNALVGEVLTLARLEAGVADGTPPDDGEALDVQALLASVAEDAGFEAQAAGRCLRLQLAGDGPLLPARGELLQRAFDNLLRNALKFAPAGSVVELAAAWQREAGRWTLQVCDRGPGLSEADCERIFEPFVRAGTATGLAGFGLGLAIARRAVQAHGGQIDARPREGGGLVVSLSLPVPVGAPAASAFTGFNANAGGNPEDAAAGACEDLPHDNAQPLPPTPAAAVDRRAA